MIPTHGKVLIEVVDEADDFGLVDDTPDRPRWGVVKSLGTLVPGYTILYGVGDKVLLPAFKGRNFVFDGVPHLICLQSEIDLYECSGEIKSAQ